MLKRIFSLSNGALLVALSLSTIAAWYSIIGLTAIFAGAVVPIIIMGTALEFAKITTTVWLRKYWHRCSLIMKVYLVPAVVLLALLTSMGIFGFLSKAHLDQNIGSGDVQAQVSLLDEKISTQRENIKSAKSMLAQMDQQVNDIMTKGDSEKSVERSVTIRKQQAKERASLQKDIEVANKEIQKLNEERAPIASELRKVEAEVGPIKYIAALIYGDNADQNMLEAAVRWVIILLVSVFDPLAIMLVLAANQSKDWDANDDVEEENKLREQVEHEKVMSDIEEHKPDAWVADVGEPPTLAELEPDIEVINDQTISQDPHPVGWMYEGESHTVQPEIKEETILDQHPYLNKPFVHFENTTPLVHKPEVEEVIEFDEVIPEVEDDGVDEAKFLEDFDANLAKGHETESPILTLGIDDVERPGDYVTVPEVKKEESYLDHPSITGTVDTDYVLYNGKRMSMEALRSLHPELFLIADNVREPKIDFGLIFPNDSIKGDTFVRVDSNPNRVFKNNGKQWIETNRELTDSYLSNEKYLTFLVDKISTGEYDPELLTNQEQDAIAEHISKK